LEAPDLPARAGSKSDTYATRSNTNADAGATTVIAIVVVSAIFDIALARSIVIAITVFLLNDDASTATRAVAAAILIADRSNIFDTAIRQYRKTVRERRGVCRGAEQRSGTDSERDYYTFHDFNSFVIDLSSTRPIAQCSPLFQDLETGTPIQPDDAALGL
jgi:hypothetical protein